MEENEKKQERKAYAKRGQRSQKMVTFRLDNVLEKYLDEVTNKGRFINEAIRQHIIAIRKHDPWQDDEE